MLPMRKSTKVIAASVAFSLMFSSQAHAYQWEKIASGMEPDEEYFVDKESIEVDGDIVTFWDMASSVKKFKYKKTKTKVQMNCKEKSYKIDHIVTYDKNDQSEMSRGFDEWFPVVPQTINEMKMKYVCKSRSN